MDGPGEERTSLRARERSSDHEDATCEHTDARPTAMTGREAVPSRFVCPRCGGVLWEDAGGEPLRWRCPRGHAYGPAALARAQDEAVEEALWAALRAAEDRIALARRRGRRERLVEAYAVTLRALLRPLQDAPGPTDDAVALP